MKISKLTIVITLMIFMVMMGVLFLTSCEKESLIDNDNIKNSEKSIYAQESIGERIINSYLEQNQKSLDSEVKRKGSNEYLDFLFRVSMGDYPDLTGKKSDYIKSSEELDAVIDFITKELAPRYNNYPSDPIKEDKVLSPTDKKKVNKPLNSQKNSAYNGTAAKDYALTWVYGRNSNYPDFSTAGGGGDCTNFVSQAVQAGGITMHGSGDGCKHEVNSSEWYVHSGGSWNCWGSWSDWEWSTPWAATWPFRDYHSYKTNNATTLGWTTSAMTAWYYMYVGDVVQLQQLSNGSWSTYHTMIVTKDSYPDIYVSYHSGDTKDKKLSDIPLGSTKRFVLVRF